ncbi:TPA: hypothetical protein UM352_004048 [Stenotrophomonas maltophilia]|nr:hypothetical protein [Stenotrophomonas maltophilia]
MTNDNKTLADVRPGGGVRLGDAPWPEIDAILADAYSAGATGLPFEGIARRHAVCAAFAALSAQPSRPSSFDLEAMLAACIPGGDIADPQVIADNIRHWFAAQPSPGGQGDSRSEKAATFLRQYLTYLRSSPRQGLRPRWCDVYEALEVAIEALAARQPSKQPDSVALGEATEFCIEKGDRKPVGEQPAIPEGWALVDLAEYTVLPQIPTTAMMDAGWPIGEQITDQFDVKGAYADLIAEHEAKGEGIIHGPIQVPAQAVDLRQPDPTLLSFYQVSDFPSLVTALEAHVLQLIDLRKRSVKPWEDTMPPTLLPMWVRENSPVLAKDLLALAEKWQDEAAVTWGESPAHAAKQQCCDELRALIDSQAVGK